MIIWGSKAVEKVRDRSTFYCPSCQACATCSLIDVKRYFTLYFIPLFPTSTLGSYVRCDTCAREFDPGVLQYTEKDYVAASQPAGSWECIECGNVNSGDADACFRCHSHRQVGESCPPPLPPGF